MSGKYNHELSPLFWTQLMPIRTELPFWVVILLFNWLRSQLKVLRPLSIPANSIFYPIKYLSSSRSLFQSVEILLNSDTFRKYFQPFTSLVKPSHYKNNYTVFHFFHFSSCLPFTVTHGFLHLVYIRKDLWTQAWAATEPACKQIIGNL